MIDEILSDSFNFLVDCIELFSGKKAPYRDKRKEMLEKYIVSASRFFEIKDERDLKNLLESEPVVKYACSLGLYEYLESLKNNKQFINKLLKRLKKW